MFRFGSFQIGIDAEAFRGMAETTCRNDTPPLPPHRLMIGVDRIDYSEGIPSRLWGMQAYLSSNTADHERISFIQIAPPTREDVGTYADIRREFEQLSGEVNGEFSDIGYVPVQYIHRSIARPTIAGLLRRADIALVTPFNDGMDLVAQEYIAAQDPTAPGVLILSEFSGAAEQLGAGALLVNPHDLESVAAGIRQAVQMSTEERCQRHAAMWESVTECDNA